MDNEHFSNTIQYCGRNVYDEQATLAFCKTQFNIFQVKKQVFLIIAFIVCVLAGLSGAFNNAVSIIFISIGCWFITMIKSIPKGNAEKILEAMNGKFPSSLYKFDCDGFDIYSGKDRNRIEYDSIIRLVDEGNYCFLFATPQIAYMIRKDSLDPCDIDGFMEFISYKADIQWTLSKPWYMLGIKDLLNRKK